MNNNKIKFVILCVSALGFILAAGIMISCSDNPVDSKPSGSPLTMSLSIASSPELMQMVDAFVVHVSGDGFDTLTQSLEFDSGFVRGTIESVPAGANIKFTAVAMDGLREIYKGSTFADVIADDTIEVDVVLKPVISMVMLSPRYLEVGPGETNFYDLKVYNIVDLSQLSFRLHWDFPGSISFSTEIDAALSNRVLVYDTLGGFASPPYYYACALLNMVNENSIVDANGNATLGTVSFISPIPEIMPHTMMITVDSLTMYDTAKVQIIAADTIYGDQAMLVIDGNLPFP